MKNISAPNFKIERRGRKKNHKIKENHYYYYDFPTPNTTEQPSLPLKTKTKTIWNHLLSIHKTNTRILSKAHKTKKKNETKIMKTL